ncbi:hypothetical protein [Acetobacterium sp.]|uniref:hypothetical protein n=1 Tax=Acetobacterium sp. TaxID=1872094 RepID=UPI0027230433|nr:hypothetical protein [Acetobacterium sp.]MDO9492835.1 hypothetical protein [Acetobacterium sp.]
MNRKAIKSILAKTHRNFVESIKDETVKELVNKNSIITGGAITSLLTGEEVNDYDYYFTNKETCLAVANYYANQFSSTHKGKNQVDAREDEFGRITCFISSTGEVGDDEDVKNSTPDESNEEDSYKAIYFTSNAITLTGKIQLVIRFYGDPVEIHKNYDFVHCTNYWLSSDRDLHLNIGALESILAKELLYQGSKYPLCSIIRTRKFIKRGWSINAGQYVKMAMQLNDLDLKNIEVLKEQLTGVDSSYFDMFISAIQRRQDDDPGFELNAMVVSELIDKIF